MDFLCVFTNLLLEINPLYHLFIIIFESFCLAKEANLYEGGKINEEKRLVADVIHQMTGDE